MPSDSQILNNSTASSCMMLALRIFLKDESGATSIEYALIAAGIALAIIAAVNSLGTTLSKKFSSINSSLK